MLALSVGLLMPGVAARRVAQIHRTISWFFILCLAGLLTVELRGGITTGLLLVALADISTNRK